MSECDRSTIFVRFDDFLLSILYAVYNLCCIINAVRIQKFEILESNNHHSLSCFGQIRDTGS